MNTTITPLAVAKLTYLLYQEKKNGEQLFFRVIPLTSGCGAPTFALEITEPRRDWIQIQIAGIPFAFPDEETIWMDGLVIDINRENGKFSIYHQNPPFFQNCQLPNSES